MSVVPKIAVVLINLNQEHHTRECIQSLRQVPIRQRSSDFDELGERTGQVRHGNLEIILIDNGSTDGSAFRLKNEFPEIIVLRNEANLGFAEGNNIGIRFALQRGAEYVVLLNNDTIVESNFLIPLLELADKDPTIGVQSGKIMFHSAPNLIWYAGGHIHIHKGLAVHRGIFEEDKGQHDHIEETGYATGCLMFLTKRALEEVGELERSFFAYFEDFDWCLRAREKGFRVVYNPGSKIWHKVSTTSTHDSPAYLYFTMRNKILFVRRHSTMIQIILHLPYFFYFYARQLLRLACKWRSWMGVRAVLLGISDGIRNRTFSQSVVFL